MISSRLATPFCRNLLHSARETTPRFQKTISHSFHSSNGNDSDDHDFFALFLGGVGGGLCGVCVGITKDEDPDKTSVVKRTAYGVGFGGAGTIGGGIAFFVAFKALKALKILYVFVPIGLIAGAAGLVQTYEKDKKAQIDENEKGKPPA